MNTKDINQGSAIIELSEEDLDHVVGGKGGASSRNDHVQDEACDHEGQNSSSAGNEHQERGPNRGNDDDDDHRPHRGQGSQSGQSQSQGSNRDDDDRPHRGHGSQSQSVNRDDDDRPQRGQGNQGSHGSQSHGSNRDDDDRPHRGQGNQGSQGHGPNRDDEDENEMPPGLRDGCPFEDEEFGTPLARATHEAYMTALENGASAEEAFEAARDAFTATAEDEGMRAGAIDKALDTATRAFNNALERGADAPDAFMSALKSLGSLMLDKEDRESLRRETR